MPDDSYWESFFNPRCILERLDCVVDCGDVVEFGCGYGTFTIPAAELIKGQVIALDIEPGMVVETLWKATEANRLNVTAEVRDFVASGCGRVNESVGYAMLFNILHIEDPIGLLREAYRILIPGGLAGIIHWPPRLGFEQAWKELGSNPPNNDARPRTRLMLLWPRTF